MSPVLVEDTLPPAFQTYPELSTGQVTVIGRDAFQADHHSVADVLEITPGVQIQSTGELGSYSTLSVRGATGQQSLVFVDGILLTGSGGGSADLGQIPLDQVESIEIYRTAAPPQFSQDAMGGVINIVTREDSQDGSRTQMGVKLGSFGLREARGAHHWTWGGARLNIRASALSAENDFPFLYDAGTPDVSEDDVEQRRNNADYERYSASADVTRQVGHHQWLAAVNGQWSTKSLPAWNNNDVQDTYYRERKMGGSLAWSATGMADGRLDQSIRYRANSHEGHLNDPASIIGLNQNDSYDSMTDQRLQHLGAWYWGTHITTLVNEASHADLSFKDKITDRGYQYDEWTWLTSLTDEWVLMSDRLSLTGTVRSLSNLDDTQLWGGLLGVRYQLTDEWTLKANVSQTFRQPSLFERYGDQGYFQGNEELVPETGQLVEGSIEYQRSDLEGALTVYNRYAFDNIAPVYDSQGVGRYVNIGQVQYQGVEWDLKWRIHSWTLSQQGAYQPSLITSPVVSYDGNQAPGYYRWSHQSRITADWNPWRLHGEWRFENGLFYDRANSTQAPQRSEFDIGLRRFWQWRSLQQTVEVSVINAFDNRSMDISRKPLPGRQFVAGYSLTF
ncbi:TonB-dependent receptor plug domain-containing protein [Saccharospirillum salsuginis]|uniref:TonB-dependent receptor n=1 Tax=Saccharospirillum salsuginis TaxID=418750 RepID=A0A918K0Z3_9GAMM|nr:TonB-dependent receptor [Saccharospirillum salsuginis]GGX41166.1 TonB-dependent receptor [Saccharospirillum salsuginis]